MDFRLGNAARAFEIVEVAALMRRPDMLDEHPIVARRMAARRFYGLVRQQHFVICDGVVK
jgi:hypothetical protein